MPRLWTETIEAHRSAVRDAVLDTTWSLVAEHGLRSITMSRIAEAAGIGRATLYKYFADIEAILAAWHQRQVAEHLQQLRAAREGTGDPSQRLEAVLAGYARITRQRGHHGLELRTLLHHGESPADALLHHGESPADAETQLIDLLVDTITDAAESGQVRDDIVPVELAHYCRHALGAATDLDSDAALRRLVAVTLAGLQAASGASASAHECCQPRRAGSTCSIE